MKAQPRYHPGDRISGRYQVYKALMGGMGEVYLCLDLSTNLPYALKTFQARYLTNLKLRGLFEAEVATWVALEKHANIVRCFYLQVLDNQPFMFLEWIAGDAERGVDLRNWLRHGPLDLRTALAIILDVCRGLIHAQEKQPGIVHRDLKPENILVAQGSVAKITDFGLARVIQHAEIEIAAQTGQTSDQRSLWGVGGIAGTPPYMAPEQWSNNSQDVRTDIYAIGCIFYELLSGHLPFQGATVDDFRWAHLHVPAPALPQGIRSENWALLVEEVLSGCMAKAPADRFASVQDLVQALEKLYVGQFAESPRNPGNDSDFSAVDYTNRGSTYDSLRRYADALANFGS